MVFFFILLIKQQQNSDISKIKNQCVLFSFFLVDLTKCYNSAIVYCTKYIFRINIIWSSAGHQTKIHSDELESWSIYNENKRKERYNSYIIFYIIFSITTSKNMTPFYYISKSNRIEVFWKILIKILIMHSTYDN